MNPNTHNRNRAIATVVSLLTAGIVVAETPDPATYRIMNEAEVTRHSDAMRTLSGPARERYRNVQYAQLRRRAEADGYRLPATPPWDGQGKQAEQESQRMKAEAAARHAEMRQRMQQARPAPPTPPLKPSEPSRTPAPTVTTSGDDALTTPPMPVPVKPAAPTKPAIVESTPPAGAASPAAAPAADAAAEVTQTDETASSAGSQSAAQAGEVATPQTPGGTAIPGSGGVNPATTAAPASSGNVEIERYRQDMRSRFDDYMQERQAQREEAMRVQREQREAAMENSRAQINRYPAPAYPAGPGYGPRYPAAFPGYRTPYWQQQQR